jgi:TRAP-type C4-dicarboxylate transport system permease small subunit
VRTLVNVLEKIMGAVANGGLAASGAALFLGAFVVLVQVSIRYGELAPVSFGDELSGYILAFSALVGAGAAFQSGVLPRLVIFTSRLVGRTREAAELLNLLAALAFCSVLVFQSWGLFAESWRYAATSILLEVPLAIPQGAMLLGILILWSVVAVALCARIAARSKGGRSVPREER